MNLNTTFIGWQDDRGFHVVGMDTGGDQGVVRWSLRSTEWQSWSDGAATIAEAILGDRLADRDRATREALIEHLAGASAEWDLGGKHVSKWLTSGAAFDLKFGEQATGRSGLEQQASIPPLHDAANFGRGTALSLSPHQRQIALADGSTPRQACADARQAAEKSIGQPAQSTTRTVPIPGVTQTVGERLPWVALERFGKPIWERHLPKDPPTVDAILTSMENLAQGLTGNAKNTQQGVREIRIKKQGGAYRVIYQHREGKLVVLGIAKKGRNQQKVLADSGAAWRGFVAGDGSYKTRNVDLAAIKNLAGSAPALA